VPFHTNATVIGPWEEFTLVHLTINTARN
jgi:hypothetical protein